MRAGFHPETQELIFAAENFSKSQLPLTQENTDMYEENDLSIDDLVALYKEFAAEIDHLL